MATLRDLQAVFSTEERLRILSSLLEGGKINIPAIARETRTSKGLVSRYGTLLASLGMLTKAHSRYSLNISSPLTRAVKILLNISRLAAPFPPWVGSMGLYGSLSKGADTLESDIDLWVVPRGSATQAAVAELEERLGKRLGKEAHILLLTRERLERLKQEDKLFYHSLAFGSFVLKGDSLENEL